MSQLELPLECLKEIFEHLDAYTLYSCLLVNRVWCAISVEILWRSIKGYKTLIACLPDESKEILSKHGIITSDLTTPILDYVSFCKVLSFNYGTYLMIKRFVGSTLSQSSNTNTEECIVITIQELHKFLMNKAHLEKLSLRLLDRITNRLQKQILTFVSYPGAESCLEFLSKLDCCNVKCPEFFHQLSQICHNIQSLCITWNEDISKELIDLISVQKNLKYFNMQFGELINLTADITTLFTKFSNALTNLIIHGRICGEINHIPLSFIAELKNLQKLVLEFGILYDYDDGQDIFEDFKELQYVIFSQLQVLKFPGPKCPKNDFLIKFLENNGKNLKEFYIKNSNNSLNLAIADFCPNLRKLASVFKNDNENNELETLKIIFSNCQYLESFKVLCWREYFDEKDLFEVIADYSPKNISELKLSYGFKLISYMEPEELEPFFIKWKNRKPQKSLTLIIVENSSLGFHTNYKNRDIIKKYSDLVKFDIIRDDSLDINEDY